MADEKTKPKMKNKIEEPKAEMKMEKTEEKAKTEKVETKAEEIKSEKAEAKVEEKKEEKKEVKPVKVKKEEAIAWGRNLHASMKHCMFISRFIKNKTIDAAIGDLQQVLKFKRAIPMTGEIPHRKEKGMMSGRYPIAAIKPVILVLKGLKGNVLNNLMDLDKTRVSYASATWASRPSKKGGGRFKRTNMLIKAREVSK